MDRETLLQALDIVARCSANAVGSPMYERAVRAVNGNTAARDAYVLRVLTSGISDGEYEDAEKRFVQGVVADLVAAANPDAVSAPSEMMGHIHIRTEMRRKNRYVRAAQRSGLPLVDWMIGVCDKATSER
jgi:hypothetical protein